MAKYRENCFYINGTIKAIIEKGDFEYVRIVSNHCSLLVKNKGRSFKGQENLDVRLPIKALTFKDTDKIFYLLED